MSFAQSIKLRIYQVCIKHSGEMVYGTRAVFGIVSSMNVVYLNGVILILPRNSTDTNTTHDISNIDLCFHADDHHKRAEVSLLLENSSVD